MSTPPPLTYEQAARDFDHSPLAGLPCYARLRQVLNDLAGEAGEHHVELGEPKAREAARLCRLAGADEALIPRWVEEGRGRAARARTMPHSGRLHR
jgi:hypothetical protein